MTDGDQPAFSVVVLNWNSLSFLRNCLDSLRRQTCRSFELICVDNGSTDGSVEWLESVDMRECVDAPSEVVFRRINTGFAAGMNVGIRRARGKWVLPLNVDVVLADDFLENAARVFEENTEVAMVGAKICRYADAPTDEVICTGVWLSPHFSVTTKLTDADEQREVFGPAGCCPLFVRKALLAAQLDSALTGDQENQFYDELYFAYGEDVDLYMRLHLLGFRCMYAPSVRAWHVHSGTQDGIRWHTKDAATLKRLPANAFFTWLKNCPPGLLFRRGPRVIAAPFVMSLALLFRRPGVCLAPLATFARIIRRLPRTLRIRRYLQRRRQGEME